MSPSALIPPLRQWFEERLPLKGAFGFLQKKTVPVHRHTLWYYCGNMLLTCFVIQVITGISLLFHYQPTPDTAYESIRTLIVEVPYGWFVRSLHSWSSQCMIAILWVHFFSTFLVKAYRPPRELTWITGLCLFVIVLGLGFSGYLLPWNELSYFATKVGTGIVGQVPWVGHSLKVFLRGGEEVGAATLTRFFAMHVALLPLSLAAIAAVHLWLIQKQGMSVPVKLEAKKSSLPRLAFWPEFLLRDLALSCGLVALLATLAVLAPAEVGKKFEPLLSEPSAIEPEWYFLFMFKVLQLIPAKIGPLEGATLGVLFFFAGYLFFFLTPWADRRSAQGKNSPAFTVAGLLALGFVVGLTLLAVARPE